MTTILTDVAYLQAMAAQHDGSKVPEIVKHRQRLDGIALRLKGLIDGEACRAATPQGEPKQFKPYMGPLTNEGAQSLWETLNDTERHDQTPVHIHFAYALLRRYGPPKEPPAPATGEQEREAFEKWFSGDGKWPKGIERDKSGYLLMTAATAWDVWQARAALSAPQAAPATGSVLTDEQIDKFAVQFLSASAPTRNAYDVRRFARAILAAKGETS